MSDHFLSRWAKRKGAAKRGEIAPEKPAPPLADTPSAKAPASAVPAASVPATAPPLPPLESLTPDSDFTPFLQENVEETVRRQALKTLFRDPRFNVMDGLDVYIDDYSKPDPLPEGWLEKLNQWEFMNSRQEPDAEPAAEGEAVAQAPSGPLLPPPAEPPGAPDTPGDTSAPSPVRES